MVIKRLVVGQLSSNCYLVTVENDDTLIIDPGDDADYIQRKIADERLNPVSIIATHGHFDHILAVVELKLAYNIPYLMSKSDEFLLGRTQSSTEYFTGGTDAVSPTKIDSGLDANTISIGSVRFKVIKTPGHTPGSVSLYCKKEKVLFVGDLIFAGGGIGRYDFVYSSKKDLIKSIENIIKLPDDTIVYPGHGDQTTIGEEKEMLINIINPYL
jgi:glyoxylase-like metal-dependent hydrolase (beta-lactamase superfamily II)